MIAEISDELTSGDVWMMVSAALVLLMTPALAFFYGGLTRAASSVNMMMMSFISIGLVAVVWVLWGAGMTSGDGVGQVFGDPLAGLGLTAATGTSGLIGIGFGASFAIIAVAVVSGAIADRAKFGTWMVFVPVWVTLVYCPLAYMVWGGGLLSADGLVGGAVGEAVDFAGGLVVHISAGVAALVLALVTGRRQGFGTGPAHRPHNLPFVMLGAALLWFGWFGFNGGAAAGAAEAGLIWVNTLVAPAAAVLGWILAEVLRGRRPSSLGTASGIVAGLVAITPACASVDPLGAVVIGLVAGVACALAVGLKYRLGFDDSLDVVGLHLVAGVLGTVLIGVLARPLADGRAGLVYGGDGSLLLAQAVAVVVAVVYAGVVTVGIGAALKATLGWRVTAEQEALGIDRFLHAESAYELPGPGADAPAGRISDERTPAPVD